MFLLLETQLGDDPYATRNSLRINQMSHYSLIAVTKFAGVISMIIVL